MIEWNVLKLKNKIKNERDWTIVLKSNDFIKDVKIIYISLSRTWDLMAKDSCDQYNLTYTRIIL